MQGSTHQRHGQLRLYSESRYPLYPSFLGNYRSADWFVRARHSSLCSQKAASAPRRSSHAGGGSAPHSPACSLRPLVSECSLGLGTLPPIDRCVTVCVRGRGEGLSGGRSGTPVPLPAIAAWRSLGLLFPSAARGWRPFPPLGRAPFRGGGVHPPPPPPCDIPLGCCFFAGPWTVTRSSLRMLRRVAAFCRPLRPVLLLVSFPRSRSPVVWCAGAVLDVAGCAACASAAPGSRRIGGCCGGRLTVFVVHTPPSSGRPPRAPLRFRVREAHVPPPPPLQWCQPRCTKASCPPPPPGSAELFIGAKGAEEILGPNKLGPKAPENTF